MSEKNTFDWWSKQFQSGQSNWYFPTTNVEEISRRIEEIKAIGLWLDMQKQLLNATVQSLEIQRGTLQALSALKLSPENIQSAMTSEQMSADAGKMFQSMMDPIQSWLQQAPNLFKTPAENPLHTSEAAAAQTKKPRHTSKRQKST